MGQGKEALVPSDPPVSKKQPTAVLSVRQEQYLEAAVLAATRSATVGDTLYVSLIQCSTPTDWTAKT